MTIHAEDEMEEDDLTILDVQSCILTGQIIQRQKDRQTGQWKYGVRGYAINGASIDAIVRFSASDGLVIITTYIP